MYGYSVRANGTGSPARASLARTSKSHFTRLYLVADPRVEPLVLPFILPLRAANQNFIEKILVYQVLD
jgi:hypothetical protein